MGTLAQHYLDDVNMGNLGNLATGGLAQQAEYNPVYLDPYTRAVIGDQAAEGAQTQEQIIQNELYGTNPNAPNATGGAVHQQQAAMGGTADPNVEAALNNRAGRLYDAQYNQLKAAATANAPAIQGNLINQGVKGLQGIQDVGNQINAQQMQVIANQNSLRNQVVSQLFGAAGQFAGTMAAARGGGGVGGALASQMGQMNSDSNFNPQTPDMTYGRSGQAPGLGVNYGMDGNGYYGETPPSSNPSLLDRPPGSTGYGMNTNNMGYGLGYSYNGGG